MTRWEHDLVIINQPATGELRDMLRQRGLDGWELVSHAAPAQEHSSRWSFSFKRPMAGAAE